MASLLKKKEKQQRIVDLFVIPDYESALLPCMHPIGRLFKLEWTKHEFNFIQVENRAELPYFPFGVKLTHLRYGTEETIELVKDDHTAYGWKAQIFHRYCV